MRVIEDEIVVPQAKTKSHLTRDDVLDNADDDDDMDQQIKSQLRLLHDLYDGRGEER